VTKIKWEKFSCIQIELGNPCVREREQERAREEEEDEEVEEEGIEYLRREIRKGFALKWRELAVVGDGQKWIDRMEERETRERKRF